MSQQIIKQPNGKYALWSTVVDSFIVLDATPKDIIEFKLREERLSMSEHVNKIVKELDAGKKPYYQFTMSWEDAIQTIKEVHGENDESYKLAKEIK